MFFGALAAALIAHVTVCFFSAAALLGTPAAFNPEVG
jgi:hypothetical protein